MLNRETEEEFARRFYGAASAGAAPKPPADTSQPGRGKEHAEDFARSFYGMDDDSDVPALEDADDEDLIAIRKDWTPYPADVNKMIGATMFDKHIGETIVVDGKKTTFTKEAARKTVTQMRAIVGDLGMNREETKTMLETMRDAPGQVEGDDPVPRREATIDALNKEHGKDANKAFQAARAYVSKNPTLGRFLDKSGLGDDPKMVAIIARKALALHERGKLRIK
jgi:hypothetical protein